MKIVNITAVSEMIELIDEIVFHVVYASSIVIPATSTGNDSSSSTAVIKTDHTNNAYGFMLIIVIKLIASKIEATAAKCREKIMMKEVVAKRVEVIRSLYDLYGERLYRVPRSLVELVSSRSLQL
ncbi:hypothetical protein E2I00_003178 [Balaenoptera physalus]|uniref:Uncharacterized protein n=1 Tax=Balaenoptera physalus TaxID=9770 RepID=A0A6A1Q7N0_BALPH|nr:hypothetical protein E2I00_003178 [Balaenoptera physalus]